MSVFHNNILGGAAGQGGAADAGFKIDRSLRFNSADTAKLTRSVSTAGNRKTWTWSAWVKRASLAASDQYLFGAQGSGQFFLIGFLSTHEFFVNPTAGVTGATLKSTAKFRDPSAWYHIVVAVDTTQATASDRVRVYINGDEITSWATSTYPSQNTDWHVNNNVSHSIGASTQSTGYCNVYMAEIHHIDGSQLAASDFGEYDDNNVWQPKEFTGSHNAAQVGSGIVYSSGVSSPDGTIAASPNDATALFDGGTSTNCQTTTAGTTVRWTPPTTTTWSTSLRIFTGPYSGSVVVRSNGTDYTLNSNGTQVQSPYWLSHPNSSGTIDYIDATGHTGAGVGYMKAIEIDGTILEDGVPGGVNGFHLDFSDNSSASALGNDAAGSNNWTVNNLSVASGAGNDSLIDTPTNYTADSGNNGGNYATLNPLSKDVVGSPTLTDGNLKLSATTFGHYIDSRSTIAASSFDCYCEMNVTEKGAAGLVGFGIGDITSRVSSGTGSYIAIRENGEVRSYPGNTLEGTVNSFTTGDVIGMAVSSSQVKFYKNGSLEGTFSHSLTGDFFVTAMAYDNGNDSVIDLNFGQRPFAISSVPTGYKSLCTQNLPDPTIADGSTVLDIVNETTSVAGSAKVISGLSFSPDLVISKLRNQSSNGRWGFIDIVRGVNKTLASDRADVEVTSQSDLLTQFNSDGFNVGADAAGYGWNYQNGGSLYTYWAWDGGSSTSSNSDGSITTNVRANPSAGFSIIGYTGNATVGATIGHGLNSAPEWLVFKNRDESAGNWYVYHKSAGHTKYLTLDRTHAAITNDFLNNTAPTNSVVTLNNTAEVNATGQDIICYAWTSISQYSSFGSYTGNGSSDGPFVFTGFRPRFLLYKRTDAADTVGWILTDSERNTYNVIDDYLSPTTASAEGTTDIVDFLSNGFKMRIAGADGNVNNGTYVYAAFAEHPLKTARAR